MPYAEVAGLRTWYEQHGTGDRHVVLLHGALSGAESWLGQVPALVAAGYRVWVPERRGHGRTPDTAEPFHYDAMAEETIGFLDAVVGAPAHLVGWSDGAVVAALVALARPELVRRMVLIGQYYNPSGQVRDSMLAELVALRDNPPEFLAGGYAEVSPDGPGHFPVVFAKTVDMISAEPDIALARLARIAAPTLVLQGDRDEVLLQHSAAVAAAIPGGRLAVLPGTHALPIESPELVNAVITTFLAGDPRDVDWSAVVGEQTATIADSG